jgi:hypothetical protein
MPDDVQLTSARLALTGASGVDRADIPQSRTRTHLSTGRDARTKGFSNASIRSTVLSSLYMRVAGTLERSAELAEQHAQRCRGQGQRQSAAIELERAKRARTAAARGRVLALRLLPGDAYGVGETARKHLRQPGVVGDRENGQLEPWLQQR